MFWVGSCPEEAGSLSRTLGQDGGRDKNPRKPSPPAEGPRRPPKVPCP